MIKFSNFCTGVWPRVLHTFSRLLHRPVGAKYQSIKYKSVAKEPKMSPRVRRRERWRRSTYGRVQQVDR